MSRGLYWCFTLNNYTAAEEDLVQTIDCEDVAYLTYGREVGASGTPHLQGYLELLVRKRVGQLRNLLGLQRGHFELRRGTAEQAITYCHKSDNEPYVYGEPLGNKRGQRSDLLAIKQSIDDGATDLEISSEFFASWCRYRKSFTVYRDLRSPPQPREVSVYVLYGEPGTGKTRFIFEREGADLWINSDPSLQWFDGYGGEPAVLLDDYRGDGKASFLLRLLDRYPLRVPCKGGFLSWSPVRVYITSNLSPPFGHNDISAPLKRRIKKVMHLNNALDFDDEQMMFKFQELLYQ